MGCWNVREMSAASFSAITNTVARSGATLGGKRTITLSVSP